MTGHARAYRFFLAQVFAVLAILIPWQIAASKGFLNPLAFSDPVAIARSIYQWIADGTMLDDILSTMKILAVGYLIGLALGMGIGLALALSPYAKAFLGPFIVFGNAVPRIVLVPFLVTGLGFGDLPKIVLVVIVIVFVVAVTIEQGVAGINKDIVDHVTLLGAGRLGLFRDVYIPGIALWTIISARLCIGYALQAAILKAGCF